MKDSNTGIDFYEFNSKLKNLKNLKIRILNEELVGHLAGHNFFFKLNIKIQILKKYYVILRKIVIGKNIFSKYKQKSCKPGKFVNNGENSTIFF